MTGPAGFTPVDGGWGRPVLGSWERRTAPGIWQQLRQSPTPDAWAAGIYVDAPRTVVGQDVQDSWIRRPAWWAPTDFADVDTARAFLDAHRTSTQVVDALLAARLAPPPRRVGTDPHQAVLDAVAVLVVDGQVARAKRVIDGVRGATPAAADRLARLAGRAGLPPPRPGVVRAADLAEVVALLTRAISADLGLARARRWATRWLAAGCDPVLRPALLAVVGIGSPRDEPVAVAAWQAGLERVRADLVADVGAGWPSSLPGVAGDLVPPVPATVDADPAVLSDRAFASHGGACVHGQPPDGRRRVDLFFDYAAFPVWSAGGGCMATPASLGLPPDLAADLWSWSHSHDRRTVPGGTPYASDAVARHETARLRRLGARLERATGIAAVVQQHRGRGDGSCPTGRCLGTAVR